MEPQEQKQESQPTNEAGNVQPQAAESATTPESETVDSSQQRTYAILGYILPFLFFLPLLDEKTKTVPFVRFHANQQAILLVVIFAASVLYNFLFGMLMTLGYFLMQASNLAILALIVFGAYNAYNNKMKELPFVGQFKILK